MEYIPPITIDDTNLLASNIVEELPVNSSGTDYNVWAESTAYAIGDKVVYAANGSLTLYTAKRAGTNLAPGSFNYSSGGPIPAPWAWTASTSGPSYSATTTYGIGVVVGYVNGATGAFYQSRVASNVGNTPSSSPTQWRKLGGDYESWASGTTYASGDRVAVFFGTRALVYSSLQASNTGNDPATSPLWWVYVGTTFKQYDATVTYALGDTVISDHHEYESLVASNVGNALTDESKWLDLGATNRFRMFDYVNSSRTAVAEEIDVTIMADGLCDAVAVMNVTAASIQIICTAAGVEVYNETTDLTSYDAITDWYQWFFEPIVRQGDLIVTNLPPYADMNVRVIISEPGGTAECGTLVIGKARSIGEAIYGAEYGIQDYSRKVADDFGNYSIVERSFSDRASLTTVIDPSYFNALKTTLPTLRATPVVYVGSDIYASSSVFGFYRDYSITLANPSQLFIRIEIEGLS